MNTRIFTVMGAGLLGLVVAACLGFLALQLVSQPVGLSTIPASAGDELVAASKKQSAAQAKAEKEAARKAAQKKAAQKKAAAKQQPATGDDSQPDYAPAPVPQQPASGDDDKSSGSDDSGKHGDDHGSDDGGGHDDDD